MSPRPAIREFVWSLLDVNGITIMMDRLIEPGLHLEQARRGRTEGGCLSAVLTVMQSDAGFTQRFKEAFNELVRRGVPPTQAAAQAIVTARADNGAGDGSGDGGAGHAGVADTASSTSDHSGAGAGGAQSYEPTPMEGAAVSLPSSSSASSEAAHNGTMDGGGSAAEHAATTPMEEEGHGAQGGSAAAEDMEVAMDVAAEGLYLTTLEELITQAKAGGSVNAVKTYVSDAFKQSAVLKNSFIPPPGSNDAVGSAKEGETDDALHINIDAVAVFYKVLGDADRDLRELAAGSDRLLEEVKQAQLVLVKQLMNEASTPGRSADWLRQIVILLENPALLDPAWHEIAGTLFASMVKLPDADKDRLRDWIARELDAEKLGLWLAVIQQYVSIRLYEQAYQEMKTGVRVMAVLYKANQKSRRASFNDFYNQAINEELEREDDGSTTFTLEEEYEKWREDRVARRRSGRDGRPFEPSTILFYPFVLSPAVKARVLNFDAVDQMRAEIEEEMHHAMVEGIPVIRPYLVLRVERDDIIRSSISALALYDTYEYKKKLKVQFIGEEGIDEGGLAKEYAQILFRQMLNPQFGMFKQEESRCLWFNPDSFNAADEFSLVGTLIGIAVHNSIILDLRFPTLVYKKLMNKPTTLDDMRSVQPTVADSLEKMLTFDGDFSDLVCTFQLTYDCYGAPKNVELLPGGADIPVTKQNVEEYIELYVDWVLNKSIEPHFTAFRQGFIKVCGGDALNLFQPGELELLICGDPMLDFEALEKVTQYEGGYSADHPFIRWFWQVLHEMDLEHQKRFLLFVCGSDRSPIGGLGKLPMLVQRGGPDSDQLPISHTCYNSLVIVEYATKDKLAEKLTKAVEECQGFGLR